MDKKLIKYFSIFVLVVVLITLGLSIFYSRAFISSTLFMSSLLLFSYSYYIYDDKDKKKIVYILFIIGILLIISALGYMFMRIM